MAIIDRITNPNQLYDDLKRMGLNDFSQQGAKALMEYLEELSEDIGEDIEYDPIAFCCSWIEFSYEDYGTIAGDFSNIEGCPQPENYEDYDEFAGDLREWLQEQTQVVEFEGGMLYEEF